MVCLSGFISETGLYADAPARKAESKPDNLHSETTLFSSISPDSSAAASISAIRDSATSEAPTMPAPTVATSKVSSMSLPKAMRVP